MEMKQVDALIRALVNEPEQTQRESLGEILRATLQMDRTVGTLTEYTTRELVESTDAHIKGPRQAQEKGSRPWDDLGLDRRALRTEEEIRRDGFELARRFESEVFEFLRDILSPCYVDQVSQNTQGKLKKYCDIRVVQRHFPEKLFGERPRVLIEAKSHRSEEIKPLDEIPRALYQISKLRKEVESRGTRAFMICGRYTLPVPEMLEFEEVLPHYTLDIYEIDSIEGAILTDLDLNGTVEAIQSIPFNLTGPTLPASEQ